jgi:valyl-tRNA synthetase
MVMMGLKFMDQVPFRDVYIHGLVRDAQGDKMSKSKGNVLDPIDLIDGIALEPLVEKRTRGMMQPQLAEKIAKQTRKEFPDGIPAFGTDALRFTFAALATTGRDIKFDLRRIEGYRNFCNKLWNASRYVLMNTEGKDCGQAGGDIELSAADQWITATLNTAIADVRGAIEDYRFDMATKAIYEFTWSQFCDWYLELAKPVLTDDHASAAAKRGTRRTLVQTLEAMLRLTHPFMPFITEEIWQKVKPLAGVEGETIMLASYPASGKPDTKFIGEHGGAAVNDGSKVNSESGMIPWVQQFILGIRRIKGEMNIPPGKPLPVLVADADERDRRWIEIARPYLDFLARTESIRILDDAADAPESAIALVGDMKILIPMAGLIDKDAELARLDKEIGKLRDDIGRIEKKLANPSFVDKAPPAVVAKERERLSDQGGALAQLMAQRTKISAL